MSTSAKKSQKRDGTLSKVSDELKRFVRHKGEPHCRLASSGKPSAADFVLAPYNTSGPQTISQTKPRRRKTEPRSSLPPQNPATRDSRRVASSVKRKRPQQDAATKYKTPGEPGSDRDSGTNATTAHTAKLMKSPEDKHAENLRGIASALSANLREVDRVGISEDEAVSRKSQILADTMSRLATAVDNTCLAEVLRQLQTLAAGLIQGKAAKLSEENARLHEELAAANARAEKDRLEFAAGLQDQKSEVSKIKAELSEVRRAAKRDSQAKMREMEALREESGKLAEAARRLFGKLEESKKREATLVRLLKGESDSEVEADIEFQQDSGEEEDKALNRTVIEIGKRKVKMPVLDFSRLAPPKPSKLKVVEYFKDGDNSGAEETPGADADEGQEVLVCDGSPSVASTIKTH